MTLSKKTIDYLVNHLIKIHVGLFVIFCVNNNSYAQMYNMLSNNDNKGIILLWNCALKNNYDIQEADFEKKSTCDRLSHYWQRYIPVLSAATNSTFDSNSFENILSPDELSSSLSISEKLPSGTTIKIVPDVSFSENMIYSEEQLSVSTKLIEEVSLGIGISQNLYPLWINKTLNPEKTILELSKRKAQFLLEIEILDCFKNIAENFINTRITLREICSQNELLSYLTEKLNNYKTLNGRQNLADIDLFSQSEEILNIKEDLKDYQMELEQYKLVLQQYIGSPDRQNSILTDQNFDFFTQLPQEECLFSENPNLNYLDAEKASLETEYLQNKQNMAPVLSFTGSVPLNQKNSSTFTTLMGTSAANQVTLSLSLNLSSLFDTDLKKNERDYKKKLDLLALKKTSAEKNIKTEKTYYKNLINMGEDYLKESYETLKNKQQVYTDYEILFSKGECSYLELLEKKAYMKILENNIYNQIDTIWYYKWMELNCF